MIKALMAFVVVALVIGLAIQAWCGLRGRQRWRLTKIVAFSIICAALAVGLLTIIVVLF
jgi:hypothetical protein